MTFFIWRPWPGTCGFLALRICDPSQAEQEPLLRRAKELTAECRGHLGRLFTRHLRRLFRRHLGRLFRHHGRRLFRRHLGRLFRRPLGRLFRHHLERLLRCHLGRLFRHHMGRLFRHLLGAWHYGCHKHFLGVSRRMLVAILHCCARGSISRWWGCV